MASCGDGTVLVGSTGGMGGTDVPIYRVDALTGQVVQTYAEPSLPEYSGSDLFGSGMALVDGYVMIGTYSDTGAPQSGAVHVYDSATGAYLRTINHPNPVTSGSFGISIAPLGSLAIIGTYVGAAYIVDPATGSIELKITRPSGSSTNDFGNSVDSFGADVLVSGRSSSAYRFDAVTGAMKVSYDDPGMGGLFGYVIASAGDRVLVGAFKAYTTQSEAGVVHVYDADSGVRLGTIKNPYPGQGDWFGMTIAVYDDRYALIGAPRDSGNGAAYLYDLEDLSLIAEFVNPDPVGFSEERFAENLVWAGDAAVISAWRDEGYEGSVYVFEGFIPEPYSISMIVCGLVLVLRKRKRPMSAPFCRACSVSETDT